MQEGIQNRIMGKVLMSLSPYPFYCMIFFYPYVCMGMIIPNSVVL